ncbi:MAG: addiction module protein [Candidatus Binatia bacterium]
MPKGIKGNPDDRIITRAAGEIDVAWAAEVERRSREMKKGIVRPIPWVEVKSHARKRARGGGDECRIHLVRPRIT